MKNGLAWLWSIALVIVFGGAYAYWWTTGRGETPAPGAEDGLSSYEYVCDDASEFVMTLSDLDDSALSLSPGRGAAFPTARLSRLASGLYEGEGVLFSGAGEEVQITYGDALRSCRPKPSQDAAPFNWGDGPEGGSVRPDPALVAGESLLGRWRSADDARFVREFREGGVLVDLYDGQAPDEGRWTVFTKADAPQTPFPLDDDAVYLRVTGADGQADPLHFRIAVLGPEALELVYLDRGGVLRFTLVR